MIQLTEDELKRLKEIELDILKNVIEICRKINIQYFVVGGTLLGAVRHHGFIPWDDDIDIAMFRADYDRFIKEAPLYLPQNLFLQNIYTEKNYINNYSKIRRKDTIYIEASSKDFDINQGIFIDVFPMDYYPTSFFRRFLNNARLRIIDRRLGDCFYDINQTNPSLKARVALAISKLLWSDVKKASYLKEKIITSVPESVLVNVYCGAWGKREIAEKCWLNEVESAEFEGIVVNIPKGYDKYLTHVYGDYMTLPPVEKRIGHHWVEKIDFGD